LFKFAQGMEEIINKVDQSGLVQIDLEQLYGAEKRCFIDIKDQLYMGLMLKEKEFRAFVKDHDWTQYQGQLLAIGCSNDAIVPTWAYMLMANKLSGIAKLVVFGSLSVLEDVWFVKQIDALDLSQYADQKIVVKGCSHVPVPVSAYVYLTEKLTPLVQSLMFGEPCSTVPLYKRK
jgi:hypothetical protein